MRFSLKMLLALLAYAALLCASIVTVNPLWAELFLLINFVGLILVANMALFGSRERRVFYGSFVVMALAYLLLTVYPGLFSGFPTSGLIIQMSNRLEGHRMTMIGPPAGPAMGGMGGGGGTLGLTGGSFGGTGSAGSGGFIVSVPTAGSSVSFATLSAPGLSTEQLQALQASALNFQRICHTTFALLLGLIVALITQRIVARNEAARVSASVADKPIGG